MIIKIDGVNYEAKDGETVLDVCRRVGIDIPTLCYDSRLEPFTACWVCLVEIKNRRGLSPSCGVKVEPGMEVRTKGEDIFNARRTAINLLLSTHFGDCYAPCILRCPSNVDVQGYIGLVLAGKYIEAVKLIKETNPFPAICGRVCTRPCEDVCRRNIIDSPVGIDYIKRFAADIEMANPHRFVPVREKSSGIKVAAIGAGPASLTAAYYLAQRGHIVTVFESESEPGGMMRYGIPQYRLPKDIIKKEIEIIESLGATIKTNCKLGRDFSLEDLKSDGYKAIFLGIGAWRSIPMGIEGENHPGVRGGIEFLRECASGKLKSLEGKVLVIGGGNTAIDAARTSTRLGANEVWILYRRTEREMPARREEIDEAYYEGVKFRFLVAPKRVIIDSDGKIVGLECIRMELGEPDSSGRRKPVPVPGSEFIVEGNYIIAAIGQKPDRASLEPIVELNGQKIRWTKWDTIEVDPETLQTNIPGVFAGGDAVSGPATVIEAIAQGRRASFYIDKYVRGEELKGFGWLQNPSTRGKKLEDVPRRFYADIPFSPRNHPVLTKLSERRGNFDEVEFAYSTEQAICESSRCLSCGCMAVENCELKRVAEQYNAESYAYTHAREIKQIDSRHPFIEFDPNKCILCGRCVRICDELMGITALGFVGRGFSTVIAPALNKPLQETDCVTCGQCISTCPTGAIIEKIQLPKPAPWKYETLTTTCGFCNVGCSVDWKMLDGSPIHLDVHSGCKISGGNLCVKGRFGIYPLMQGRAKSPLIRSKGIYREIPIDKAIEIFPEIISKGKGVCVFISPGLTNEEIYIAQKFARSVIRAQALYSFHLLPVEYRTKEELPISSATFEDIPTSELIVLYCVDFTCESPIAGIKIRSAVKNGSHLIAVDSPTKIFRNLNNVRTITSDEFIANKGILDEYKFVERILFVMPSRPHPSRIKAWFDIRNFGYEISQKHNVGYLFVGGRSNLQGLFDMGGISPFKPNYQIEENFLPFSEALERMQNGELSALIIGEDPLSSGKPPENYRLALEGASSVIVLDAYFTPTAQVSDLFIPISLWFESAGSYTNLERRLRKLYKITDPPSGYSTLQILSEIAKLFGHKLPDNPAKIMDEIRSNIKTYANLEFNSYYDYGILNMVSKILKSPEALPLSKEELEFGASTVEARLSQYLESKGIKYGI